MEAFWSQQDVNARHNTEENVVNKSTVGGAAGDYGKAVVQLVEKESRPVCGHVTCHSQPMVDVNALV